MSLLPLVGHEPVLTWLRHALSRGRLAHAFLFVGPEGIGKRRTALHIAQGLLCEQRDPAALDPCGTCAGCVQVESDAHPDFFLIERPEGKNVLPIDRIQDLCRRLALKPARGRHRIAVVDDADLFNPESANCFLKTLEEPPPGSLLILLTTSAETQLQTIVSRCQLVRFSPLADEQVADLLVDLEVVSDAAEALRYAQWSAGSVGRAVDLAVPEWNAIRDRLWTGLCEVPLDAVSLSADLRQFIDDAGKDAAAKRFRSRQIVRLAADYYRDCLLDQQNPSPSGPADRAAPIAALAGRLEAEVLLDLIERCLDADFHITRFLNQALSID